MIRPLTSGPLLIVSAVSNPNDPSSPPQELAKIPQKQAAFVIHLHKAAFAALLPPRSQRMGGRVVECARLESVFTER
jgi:hypothetical protein